MNGINFKKNKRGFTLIEVLVAISIFITVVSVFAGFFVNIINTQKRILASQRLIDNVSYNMEYLSRSIRMANKDLNGTCIGLKENYQTNYQKNRLKFLKFDHGLTPPRDVCLEFYLQNGRLWQSKDGGTPMPLTPEGLTVSIFEIEGEGTWSQEGEQRQPFVKIILKIEDLQIETTISQRNLNVKY